MEKFKFNNIPVVDPSGFKPNMATTSTDDSDRTQDLVMHNTPMGTIESYSFEWKDIAVEDAAVIIQQIKNQAQYTLRYLKAETGMWETGTFYTSNYSFGNMKTIDGSYYWESLSFNAVGVYPV